MSAISVRVVEVIPGKSVIGLELPNKKREMVRLSEVISCDTFQSNKSPLTMVLGADISGQPVVVFSQDASPFGCGYYRFR